MRVLLLVLSSLLALVVGIDAASAQLPGRVYKMGALWIGRPGYVQEPMEQWKGTGATYRDALRDHGFVLGKNFVVEVRHAHGDATRLAAEAEALVASGVDVITTQGTPPTVAMMQVTKHIPIVFSGVGDPVEKGIVASLARPGGNVTGMAVLIAGPKQWQLLHEIAPAVRRAGLLSNAANRPAQDRQAEWETF
jgi:putative ABC transport system substrate-binding protein